MLYFWLILGLLIFILILGIALVLWTDTEIFIRYNNGDFSLKLKNTFLRYNYPRKNKSAKSAKKTDTADNSKDSKNTKSDNTESDKDANSENKNKKLLEFLKDFDKTKSVVILIKDLIKLLRYKLYIKKLEARIDYGSGDAADTGIACGAFWTGYGTVLPILINYFRLNNPQIRFTPWFNEKLCDIRLESIIKVKIGHIINAIIRAGINYLRQQNS